MNRKTRTPKHIKAWHDYIEKHPERHGKDIHKLKEIVAGLLEEKGLKYRDTEVERFIEFCRSFRHTEGRWSGSPFEPSLEQKYFVACVLGFYTHDPELKQEVRYFREAALLVSRKWGKSMYISALAAYMLLADREAAPQVWCLATQKSQAGIVYKNVKRLLETSPDLTPRDSPKLIWRTRRDMDNTEMVLCNINGGYMKAGSKNSKGQDGLNPSCFIIDELHAITDRNTYDVFSSAQGARTQPLSVIISTFGFVREGIFDSVLERCRNVLSGKTADARLFPMIFRIDDDDKPEDRSCWIKANPGIPEARPTMSYLEGEYGKALDDPAQMPSFLAKHLNRATNGAEAYFDLAEVDACAEDMTEADYCKRYAVGGVDLAETTDLCCASILVPIGNELKLFQRYFVASARIEQNSKTDKMAYLSFQRTNAEDPLNIELLKVCDGPMVRKSEVTQWFREITEHYGVILWAIGYDRWHGGDWADEMEQYGYPKQDNEGRGVTFPVAMGAKSLSSPMKEFRSLIRARRIKYSRHNGLFRWCTSNTCVMIDANNEVRPEKAKSRARIDGFMSALLAYIAYKQRKDLFEEFVKQ